MYYGKVYFRYYLPHMQRRTLLKNLGGLALIPAFPFKNLPVDKKPVLRIAHLTDVHLKDKWDAPARFVKCLHHVQQQPGVDMILNGGDIVFDMNKENIDTINTQWKLWHNIIKSDCSLPIHYVLGNHDIWWTEITRHQSTIVQHFECTLNSRSYSFYSFFRHFLLHHSKCAAIDIFHDNHDGYRYRMVHP